MSDDTGRLTGIISADIGWDILNALGAHEDIPRQIAEIREKMSPLRAELKMLQERYQSRGRSPSHHDELRATLLAKLKEEERQTYSSCPDTKQDAKGNTVGIPLTDGRAEDLARARPEYQEFMRKAARDHKRIAQIGRDLGPMYDAVERLRGVQQHLKMRSDTAVALINAWGRESRST